METRSSALKVSIGRVTRSVSVRKPVITKSIRRDSLQTAKPKRGRPAKPKEQTLIVKESATKENTQIRHTKRVKTAETLSCVSKQASPVKVVSGEEDIQLVEKIESLEGNDFGKLLEAFREDTHNSDLSSVYQFDATSSLYSTCFERNIKLDLERYYGQSCFVCGISEGKLVRCCRDKCFSRYHLECIEPELLSDFHSYIRPKKIECRRHHCATCFAENLRSTAFRAMPDDRAYRCIYCTNAYHLNCLPAGCPQKDYKIICPQHYRRDTSSYPHLPFCFGCRSYYEDNEDVRKDCSRCLRSYHEICGQVNMRQSGAENVCFYCFYNWSPRKGQLCHVFYEDRFYPAQVAQTNWPQSLNIKGIVPLFLIGFGVRNKESLVQVPSCFIVPMIPYEPMEFYYKSHPNTNEIISGYLTKLIQLQENPYSLLPVRPNVKKSQIPTS
ncbi:hypothetical protein M3Y94_00396200 [Aphelenchoides besseyi]|nr:hypothetical protein M3Y94_00396200 [Aphelenchoides besseyi]